VKAVILAAGLGTRLEPVTGGLPKCLVPVAGRTILDRMIERLVEAGLDDLVVVTGHRAGDVERYLDRMAAPAGRRAARVFNPRYADWGNFHSLLVAERAVGGDGFVKLDADVVMDDGLLPALLAAPGPAALAVDRSVELGDEEMKARVDRAGRVVELSKRIDPAAALGESVGIDRIDTELAPLVWRALRRLIELGETGEYYERAYELLMRDGIAFSYADVSSCQWVEVDDADDLAAAEALLSEAGGRITASR
jgi:choline kinase